MPLDLSLELSEDNRRCAGVCDTAVVAVRDESRRPCQSQRARDEDRERQVSRSPHYDPLQLQGRQGQMSR